MRLAPQIMRRHENDHSTECRLGKRSTDSSIARDFAPYISLGLRKIAARWCDANRWCSRTWLRELVTSIAFSPDGKNLASARLDYTVILWNAAARKPLGEPLASHKDSVSSVAFSPDRKTLASASKDYTVILWHVAKRKPLGELGEQFAGYARYLNEDNSVAFSHDRKILAPANKNFDLFLWDVESWRDRACGVANRNFTCEEWRNFIGERPYRHVCETLSKPKCS